MDISFSPDLPAWVCYVVVLAFGALTGWREVIEKLSDARGIWRFGGTWLLMIMLALSPAVLFWLLDRAGTVSDTSIVGAAIVGVAYTQILKGNSQYKAPGATSPFWDFVSWWREQINRNLLARTATTGSKFDHEASEEIATPTKYPQALQLAQKLSEDPVTFSKALCTENTRLLAANPPLDPEAIQFRLAEQVYKEIRRDTNWRTLVVEHGLIDKRLLSEYFGSRWRPRIIGSLAFLPVVWYLLGLGVPGAAEGTGTIGERLERTYLINRLTKKTGSAPDLARVTARLMARLNGATDGAARNFWLEALREPLRDPTLSMQRVDAAIQVLLAARDHDKSKRSSIADGLLYALRNTNVDARRRIQSALVYLACGAEPVPAQDLLDWNPTEGDAVPQIERRIDQWRTVWAAQATRPSVTVSRSPVSCPARGA